MDAIVLRRAAVPLVAAAAMFLPVTAVAAVPHKAKACTQKTDKAGNWEVVLGTKHTLKSANALVASAKLKSLTAVAEANGCGSFEVAIEGLKTQKAAMTMETKARTDGLHASVEQS